MAETTKIQWTDHTFNPVRGCTKVSPGCANCYAEKGSKRNPAVLGEWGPDGKRVIAAESYWRQPLKWDREAKAAGVRRRVFCASLADVFEDNDQVVEARERLWDTIDATPHLDWLLLTKRPENLGHMVPWCRDHAGEYRERFWDNVWLGVSVEDQKRAGERIPKLLEIPAAVRFLSVEPLLGRVDLERAAPCGYYCDPSVGHVDHSLVGIDWVIVGGESGPSARPCRLEWIRSIVAQCEAAGVACFVKQLGADVTTTLPDFERWPGHDGPSSPVRFDGDGFGSYRVYGLKDLKGGDPSEWPEDLRVREFPTPRA